MDPYLEREEIWHDFHERFIPYAAAMLTPQVRPNYIVKLDEHVFIRELPAEERRLIGRSDVSLSQRSGSTATAAPAPSRTSAPMYVNVPALAVDEERLSMIEIRDRESLELVTVIELLSPSNKTTGRKEYLIKREEYLQSGVRLVEIDLLRGGPRLPMEQLPACDYCVLVARPEEMPRAGVWAISLRSSLPEVPIPLRPSDVDARLDLQALLTRVYDDAGYSDYIYAVPPRPPLNPEDADWARRMISAPQH